MKATITFLIILVSGVLFSQNNEMPPFSYKLTEDIDQCEEKRYLCVQKYLKQDSLFQGKTIYFSPYLADLDFFYFKDMLKGDSILNSKSFVKYKWFDDYYSSRLNCIMGDQRHKTDYIAFFSLVENGMLRVDVFFKRSNISSIKFYDVSSFPGEPTKSYLFIFEEESSKIRKVFRIEIIYD